MTATKVREAFAAAQAEAPEVICFVSGRGNGYEMTPVRAGDVLHLVVVPPVGASHALLLAYSQRATASVTGTCPACGARRHLKQASHHGEARLHLAHEDDCPASDKGLHELLEREGYHR